MALAKVDGILLNNDKIRQEQLRRIYWKDKQYTDFGGDFVENVNIGTKEVSPIGEGRDLLYHTFDGSTDFSKDMLKKYMSNGVNHEIYEVAPVPDGDRFRWDGDYFEGFEPNNTRYKVAQVKLAEGEQRVSFANEGRFLKEKYLTPGLLNFYGSKVSAEIGIVSASIRGRLDGIINLGEGRIADIPEANVNIIDDYFEAVVDDKKHQGAGFDNLREQFKNAGNKRYVEYVSSQKLLNNLKKEAETVDDFDFSSFLHIPDRGIIDNYKEFSYNTFVKSSKGNEIFKTYDEKDIFNEGDKGIHDINSKNGETYVSIEKKEKSLLSKTNELFNRHKIATMIGRFHTTLSDEGVDSFPTTIDSAVREGVGNSKGRNLLTKSAENGSKTATNGYDNPYCRVWTYHHQYDNVSKLIRPFRLNNGEQADARNLNPYMAVYLDGSNGSDYLKDNTVLGENGFVNIAPKKDGCGKASSVEIKKCMFSIENLAWKDVPRKGGVGSDGYYIEDEQRGPNGGRIMWFPPYDLNFQESVNVNWNQNNFIGRGEPVFTYSNTNRNGVLSFVILVDHPSIIDNIPKNNLKSEVLSDEDILRYFAGCDIPTEFGNSVACDNGDEKPENNKKASDEPKKTFDKKNAKHIRFNVYFPNNYSGFGQETNKSNWKQKGSSDNLWYQYLLFGENAEIKTGVTAPGNGYETNNNGITKEGTVNPNNGISVAEKSGLWSSGTGEVKGVYYMYRVDFDLRQNLKNLTRENQTRGMGYETSNYIDKKGYSLNVDVVNQDSATDYYYSFSEVIAAMVAAKPTLFDDFTVRNIPARIKQGYSGSTRFNELVELFKNGSRIGEIQCGGFATEQDPKNSHTLAERRCESIKGIIKQFLNGNEGVISSADTITVAPKLTDDTDINTLDAKRQRMAFCEIWYDSPTTGNVSETTNQIQDNKVEATSTGNTLIVTEAIPNMRYESEAEYFKNIDKNDPLIHKKLIEKFKYFNPAFHSISPEGFNARLTFLQQCTRQGHTIETASGNFSKTAGNLSFGRMPVCVLRLGDFINTRVIINGLSVNYDTGGAMQWDLNPEGIGVQPMYAKVSLQITILGGQSLEGPINRLQNAVTFNYYANTGVYDNRSDRIGYEVNNVVTNEVVRLEKAVETSGDKYIATVDESEYSQSMPTYKHLFTPYPNTTKKKI